MGRTIPCLKLDTDVYNHPHACYDPILNYILDFDYEKWEPYLNDTTDSAKLLLNFSSFLSQPLFFEGTIPKQNVLFDFPLYYIGKYVTSLV